MRSEIEELIIETNLELILTEFQEELINYDCKKSSYDRTIRARILRDLKDNIFNLKDERENRDNPRFQKG